MRKTIKMISNPQITDEHIKFYVNTLNEEIGPFKHKAEAVRFSEKGYVIIGTDYTEKQLKMMENKIKDSQNKASV